MDKNLIFSSINLAKKNLGITSPNPTVGCIITKNNKIISTGITQKGGRPHAENIAINKIKDKSKLVGSTLYVSLEPCCHYGKTPPCTDLIIESKIKKVVIGAIDNNPQVNYQGIEKLRKNNIEVEIIEHNEAYKINRGFFKVQKEKLPFISLKIAISSDYKIAAQNSKQIKISNNNSHNFTHYLRSINDAIIIGKNTLINDNPRLNCRLSGLEEYSPTRFVIANNIDFSDNYKIFSDCDKIPTFIVTKKENRNLNIDNFLRKNVKFIFCDQKNNQINLKQAFKKIKEQDINSVLIEGGKQINSNLISQNLVDELILIKNDKEIGESGLDFIDYQKISNFSKILEQNFKLTKRKKSGSDDLISFYNKK